MTSYFSKHGIYKFDRTIAVHPFIDACNASIVYWLLKVLPRCNERPQVLDLGCGSGQVTRLLRGVPDIDVHALDADPECHRFYSTHPELRDVTFWTTDFLHNDLPRPFDVVVARGVLHHVPPLLRPDFFRRNTPNHGFLIIADEVLAPYANHQERQQNCDRWYGHVINEALRRGITELAELEREFREEERRPMSDDDQDFKESLIQFHRNVEESGMELLSPVQTIGNFEALGGGFFTAVLTASKIGA